MDDKQYTPMMQQYLEVKSKLLDAIVFYRLGDFYEMFFEDAKVAAGELDLVITGRNAGVKDKVPMCGIPYHAASSYITRLTQKGYKVAIVEQLSEPGTGKLVERGVIKIITPGTVMETTIDDKATSYLAAIYDYQFGKAIVYCEMTCGELKAHCIGAKISDLQKALLSMNIREVVVKHDFDTKSLKMIRDLGVITISYEEDTTIPQEYLSLVKGIDNEVILKSFGLMINYLEYTQKQTMGHLGSLKLLQADNYLQMDYATKTNLELINPLRVTSSSQNLWNYIDKARSSMGSRLLKQWIEYPLINESLINQRLDAIAFLNQNFIQKDELREYLGSVYDMERLCARVAINAATPRDIMRLASSLSKAPQILAIFKDCPGAQDLRKVDDCHELQQQLDGIIVENPPANYKDGGIFVDGYNEELDASRSLKDSGHRLILEIEKKEQERTGINSLKIGYNRIYGYYIEVRKGSIDKILPEYGYVRKQTLVGAERYISEELKAKEEAILHAEETAIRLERELFASLIETIKSHLAPLHQLAQSLAYCDAIYALSVISAQQGYVRPEFTQDNIIDIKDGKHPILVAIMRDKPYVANSLKMDIDEQIYLITGPNMGGKSTYMRQVALIVIMAQIGCYVPATYAKLPIFDSIFTRIGANDDIMSGQSTFMVEMQEANYALQHAGDKSLILFDEIGRGTSTYDGMSLAHAMIEYIAKHTQAKTLFSTHYHELTALGEKNKQIQNYHVEVHEENDDVTFLYRVSLGKANKSYGINVARLAHLPNEVIQRAKYLLNHIQNNEADFSDVADMEDLPQSSEDPQLVQMKQTFINLNIDDLSPKEALMLLYEFQKQLKIKEPNE